MEEIMVTILTTAFNHEEFIAQAIEGVVSQKTNFRYQLVIHDDASTDKTAEIIRDYAKRYPDKIIAICQTENQYSKGTDIYSFMIPHVHGKYVALCEGDDFWCDENKLQRQVDFLESHPEYSACVHNTWVEEYSTKERTLFLPHKIERDIPFSEICMHGGGGYQSSSLLTKNENWFAYMPDWYFMGNGIEDYPYAIYLALQGPIHFFPEVMSVYRSFTPSSWSRQNLMSSLEMQERIHRDSIKMLEGVRSTDGKKYAKELTDAIAFQKNEIYVLYRGKNIPARKKLELFLEQPFTNKKSIITDMIQYNLKKRFGRKK